jgi:hypothetical protein
MLRLFRARAAHARAMQLSLRHTDTSVLVRLARDWLRFPSLGDSPKHTSSVERDECA